MTFPDCKENIFSDILLKKFILLLSLTSLFTFIAGNLFLLNKSALISSISVAVVSQIILFFIFSIAHLTRSLTWGLATIYSVLAVSAFFNMHWLQWIILTISLYGFITFIRLSYKATDTLDIKNSTKAIILGVLVVISAKIPGSFDMLDRLEQGLVHRDTLFHASIASMIKNYGVVTTGLNGLIETP